MQEIFLAIQTGVEEIWGMSESINLTRYVFNKYVTLTQIRNEITTYISKHCSQASNFQYNISTEIIKFEGKELLYAIVTVITEDYNGNELEHVQKFLMGS